MYETYHIFRNNWLFKFCYCSLSARQSIANHQKWNKKIFCRIADPKWMQVCKMDVSLHYPSCKMDARWIMQVLFSVLQWKAGAGFGQVGVTCLKKKSSAIETKTKGRQVRRTNAHLLYLSSSCPRLFCTVSSSVKDLYYNLWDLLVFLFSVLAAM